MTWRSEYFNLPVTERDGIPGRSLPMAAECPPQVSSEFPVMDDGFGRAPDAAPSRRAASDFKDYDNDRGVDVIDLFVDVLFGVRPGVILGDDDFDAEWELEWGGD